MNDTKDWKKLSDIFPPENTVVWTRKFFEEKGKTKELVEHMIFRDGKMYVSDFSTKMYYLADEWALIN
jgi:hypothetical protein